MSQEPIPPPAEPLPRRPAREGPIPISINGNVLEPNAPATRALGLGVGDAARSDHILVQTKDYLNQHDKEKLAELQVEVEELVSDKTYLCQFKLEELERIRELDFVTWASVYGSPFVVAPDLKPSTSPSAATTPSVLPSQAHEVDVIFHENRGQVREALATAVAKAAHVHPETLAGGEDKIRLVLQDRYLNDVAKLDEVRAILPATENKLYNEVARNILMGRGDIATASDITKGPLVLRGNGEIVAVADTGVDSRHAAFGTRILAAQAWGRTAQASGSDRTDDPDGHGTHVAGSVLGDDMYAATVRVQGTAPEARLYMQSVLDDNGNLGGIPNNVSDLFSQSYSAGARVHTNSWGPMTPGLPYTYGNAGAQIDRFVREHPDMVICFAAGNEGVDIDRDGIVDPRQIGMYAAAKNNITVGASESFRPQVPLRWGMFGDNTGSRFKANPINPDLTANDSMGMAAFSNRGPSREGRIKPDVVAPGTCILSARSSIAPLMQDWGQSTNPTYMYLGGTSMACPLVAGGCAVIREALRRQPAGPSINPSAALVKALLINGAVELRGQYFPSEAGPSPNNSSGWGRVNLAESVDMATNAAAGTDIGYHDATTLSDTNPRYSRDINIGQAGRTLKITLVWTDLPGALLQNDLALSVSGGGVERYGNPTRDRRNNVEQVVWANIPTGNVQVRVQVMRLTRGSQDFALAWKLY